MQRSVIYASSMSRREARWRRLRRRGFIAAPGLAMIAMCASGAIFAITVIERLI